MIAISCSAASLAEVATTEPETSFYLWTNHSFFSSSMSVSRLMCFFKTYNFVIFSCYTSTCGSLLYAFVCFIVSRALSLVYYDNFKIILLFFVLLCEKCSTKRDTKESGWVIRNESDFLFLCGFGMSLKSFWHFSSLIF